MPIDLCPVLFCVNADYNACTPYNVVAFASYYFDSDCGVFHGFEV